MRGAELGSQAGQHSSQHVAGAAGGHSGIARGVYEGAAIGQRQDRVIALEDDVGVPARGCFQGHIEPAGLHIGSR